MTPPFRGNIASRRGLAWSRETSALKTICIGFLSAPFDVEGLWALGPDNPFFFAGSGVISGPNWVAQPARSLSQGNLAPKLGKFQSRESAGEARGGARALRSPQQQSRESSLLSRENSWLDPCLFARTASRDKQRRILFFDDQTFGPFGAPERTT